MKKQICKKLLAIALCITLFSKAFGIDNPHRYKAPYHNATKTWKRKKWQSAFDFQYANGSTHRAKNSNGDRVDAFDIYGNHNLLYLTSSVPMPSNLSSTLQGYVNAIDTKRTSFEAANPADKQTFGKVEFEGKCEVDEFIFNYRQNLIKNFFTQLNIPFRRLRTGPMTLVDQSPVGTTGDTDYTQQDSDWINFRDNLGEIMQGYGFDSYARAAKSISIGDISLLAGWQYNRWFSGEFLDYIKLSIKTGALFPTGKHRSSSKSFSLETGYNGHFGFPVRLDAIFGLSNDIYFGTYIGGIFFSSKTHNNYPVKTDGTQNGFINFYKAVVTEKKGNLFDFGTYLKLDRFFKGLSALIGYSYNYQSGDSLSLGHTSSYTNGVIINSDSRLNSWHMHVLHILTEYDFGEHDYFKKKRWQPRISLFYDYPFAGKRVFMTSMLGGSVGFSLQWS